MKGLLTFLAVVVVLPLLPFVLIGLAIWLVVRASRSSRHSLRIA